MNYSSGVWGLGSITVAHTLPTDHVLWMVARVLLDTAGALFLLYLLALSSVTTVVLLSPHGQRRWVASGLRGRRHRAVGAPRGPRSPLNKGQGASRQSCCGEVSTRRCDREVALPAAHGGPGSGAGQEAIAQEPAVRVSPRVSRRRRSMAATRRCSQASFLAAPR